jgi:FkbM family methyltransferase
MNIKKWILDNLGNDAIVLEAGTADGNDTKFFSDYLINGKVYGFEPIPNLYEQTSQKIRDRYNVEISNLALSDRTGKSKIYISDRFGSNWGSSSLLKPKEHLDIHPELTFKEEIEIETTNLDEWFQKKDIEVIHLMWLDMQGYEPVVLMNSPIILSRTKYIYTEVSLIETYEGVMKYPEFKNFLSENNFEVVGEELVWIDMGNVLFKNKKL